MAGRIKVVVLEADFAALCRLGFPISLSLQLQQSGLVLADALWTARASGSGFSVSLFWPAAAKATKRGRKKRKLMKAKKEEVRNIPKSTTVTATATTTKILANTANHEAETPISAQQPSKSCELETSEPAEVKALSAPAPVTPQYHSTEEISIASQSSISTSDSYPFDLKNCKEVSYEKKGQLHGVSYTVDQSGATGWTPVVGRKKKRRLPVGFLRRLPPDARQRYENQHHSDSDSDSDQDLNDFIPNQAAVSYCVVDDVPGLSIETRNTRQWTPIAARTRAKLRTT